MHIQDAEFKGIKKLDFKSLDPASFQNCFADCVVLTADNRILLQKRTLDCPKAPGCLVAFGGAVEENEQPIHAVIRELREELGAHLKEKDVVSLGAVSENHSTLIYGYFWHDRHGTITGCYEMEARYFETAKEVLSHPKVMPYLGWIVTCML